MVVRFLCQKLIGSRVYPASAIEVMDDRLAQQLIAERVVEPFVREAVADLSGVRTATKRTRRGG